MAGMTISKVDVMHPLIEKYAHSITARTQMKDIISSVLAR